MSIKEQPLNTDQSSDNIREATQEIRTQKIKGHVVGRQSWSGPLPPQVIEKMSPESADRMVESLCKRQEQQDQLMSSLITYKTHDLKHKTIRIIFILTISISGTLTLIWICLAFNNTDILKELLEKAGFLIGGGGLAALFMSKKSASEPSIQISE